MHILQPLNLILKKSKNTIDIKDKNEYNHGSQKVC